MAVIEGGVSGALQGVGAESGSAAHVHIKPVPVGLLGSYRLATVTGTIAATFAANAQFFYMRWTDATRLCVIHSVQVDFQCLTAFTAGTITDFGFDMFKATAVSAGGGSTAIPDTSISKMRSTHGTSLFGATGIRRSDTALLTALTTLDAFPIAMSVGKPQLANPAAATEEPRANDPTLRYQPNVAAGEHPLTLGQNEGLVLRNRVVWPAVGTGVFKIEVAWSEVTAY